MIVFDDLLKLMVRDGGSDLILKNGGFPAVRVHGLVRYLSDQRIDDAFSEQILSTILTEKFREQFEKDG
ncbi:MAG TPA: hypothetical protein VKE69_07510, partial [Planctomycetota bacterium]|nr:hypothetical protein [Planctomycetota bacterium]